jgi:hypothetical protein
VAIANAQVAYARYRARFAGERWAELERLGARPQRPLWASTGTKDPALSDVVYVERLIAPGVINTMPEQTLRAFAEHGNGRVRWTRTRQLRRGSWPRRPPPVSILPPSPPSWSVRGSSPSPTPTPSSCVASSRNSPKSCPQPLAKLT